MDDYSGFVLIKTSVRARNKTDAKGKLERLAYGKIEDNAGMVDFELEGVMVDDG